MSRSHGGLNPPAKPTFKSVAPRDKPLDKFLKDLGVTDSEGGEENGDSGKDTEEEHLNSIDCVIDERDETGVAEYLILYSDGREEWEKKSEKNEESITFYRATKEIIQDKGDTLAEANKQDRQTVDKARDKLYSQKQASQETEEEDSSDEYEDDDVEELDNDDVQILDAESQEHIDSQDVEESQESQKHQDTQESQESRQTKDSQGSHLLQLSIRRQSSTTQQQVIPGPVSKISTLQTFVAVQSSTRSLQHSVAAQIRTKPWRRRDVPIALQQSSRFAEAYAKTQTTLAIEVWHAMKERGTPLLNNMDGDKFFIPIAFEIIATSSFDIMINLMDGNLPPRIREDHSFRRTMEAYDNFSVRAGIYAQHLVHHKTGQPPTKRIMLDLIDWARVYLADDRFARRIDTLLVKKQNSWLAKHRDMSENDEKRRYLGRNKEDKNYSRYSVLPHRKARLVTICESTRKRLEDIPNELLDNPIDRPWGEIGWSNNCKKRLQQHSSHNGSNHLMCLFDAICKLKYPDYCIEQHVVYYIWEPQHAAIAEALFTEIADPRYNTGTGFTYANPGLSNYSVMNMTTLDWADCHASVELGPFAENITNERKRSESEMKRREKLERALHAAMAENNALKEDLNDKYAVSNEILKNKVEREENILELLTQLKAGLEEQFPDAFLDSDDENESEIREEDNDEEPEEEGYRYGDDDEALGDDEDGDEDEEV
jgi:hypothetical protein